ncbi:MAG: hypothetical protein WB608_07550 [Terracidiphilus sp.]
MRTKPGLWKAAFSAFFLAGLLVLASVPGFSRDKNETIDATALGTGTQIGQNIGVTLIIYELSTPEDKQLLLQAFQKGSNRGLVNALQKMKAVGRMSVTGTLGSDVSFIKVIPTPTGRRIRFITNRPIRFGEAWSDSSTQSFDLSGGELDINDQDKNKSTGFLYPAAQLSINQEGELTIDLNQNAWKLVDLVDWKGTAGVN